ncbi:hypothetical protein scyTo_0010220 [Scyliorhinus torazame]|uniref:Uncharacterized protein n=1 Tax=Scyliorhinus torazame TaxID=75743 RepID=A0A401P277_SCYTO|nr:hypothetical protein [Scyliorhinus torazame]
MNRYLDYAPCIPLPSYNIELPLCPGQLTLTLRSSEADGERTALGAGPAAAPGTHGRYPEIEHKGRGHRYNARMSRSGVQLHIISM